MGPEKSIPAVNPSLHVMVVDDELNIRKTLSVCLETEGHMVTAVSNFKDALAEASRRSFDLAFVDLRLGTDDGLDLIPALLAATPGLKIIVITAYASIDTAVEAMRRGATDYIPKPFTPAQITLAVRKVFEVRTLEQKVAALQEDLGREHPEIDFSSTSPAMQRAVNLARQAAAVRGDDPPPRRERNRQDRPRQGHPFLEQPGGQAFQPDLLPFVPARAPGKRALRACQRGLHGRGPRQPRPDRRERRGDAAPRRDRRPAPPPPAEAPAFRPGQGIRARRREPHPEGGCAADRRHEREPGGRPSKKADSARTCITGST